MQAANALLHLGRTAEGSALLAQAQPVLERAGNVVSLGICLNQRGYAALQEGRWDEADRFYARALDLHRRTADQRNQATALWGLWHAAAHTAPQQALAYMEEYAALKDTLYQQDVVRMAADYNARYENDLLHQQNQQMRRRSRTLLLGGTALTAMLLAIVTLLLYALRQKSRAVRTEQRLRLEQLMQQRRQLTRQFRDAAAAQPDDGSAQPEAPADHPVQPGAETTAASQPDVFIQQVDALLEQQFRHCDVNLEELASQLCITRPQLNRRVKALLGESMRDHVNRLRLQRASHLLTTTDLSVGDIARACGIEDVAYFSRFFRQMTGITPSEFRRMEQ